MDQREGEERARIYRVPSYASRVKIIPAASAAKTPPEVENHADPNIVTREVMTGPEHSSPEDSMVAMLPPSQSGTGCPARPHQHPVIH